MFTLSQSINKWQRNNFTESGTLNTITNHIIKKYFHSLSCQIETLNFTLLDKEFTSRQDLKFRARDILIEARGLDIYECFSQPYAKEKACNWLVKLYMEPMDDKHNGKKLIETRTVNRINTILEHYLKGKKNE